MALPAGFTLNLDASVTADIWKTFVSGGPNTGVPADGDSINAWEDSAGGSLLAKNSGANAVPTAQISTPLMYHQCLGFASQRMVLANTTGTNQALSTIITNSAFTIYVAFYPTAINNTGNTYLSDCIIADTGGYWGLFLSSSAGVPRVFCYNYDGTQDYVFTDCALNASHVFMARHESDTLYTALDGGTETSTASGNTQVLTNDVGIGNSGSGAYFSGRIGEIAIYNTALTGTDLTDATAYFVDKWLTPAVAGYPTLYYAQQRSR